MVINRFRWRSSISHLYVRKMKELKITSIAGLIAAVGSGLILTVMAFLEHRNEMKEGILKMLLEFPAGVAFNGIYSFVFSVPFLLFLVFPLVYLHRTSPQLWNYFVAPVSGTILAFLILFALKNSQYNLPLEIVWIATTQASLAFGIAYTQLKLNSNKAG